MHTFAGAGGTVQMQHRLRRTGTAQQLAKHSAFNVGAAELINRVNVINQA